VRAPYISRDSRFRSREAEIKAPRGNVTDDAFVKFHFKNPITRASRKGNQYAGLFPNSSARLPASGISAILKGNNGKKKPLHTPRQ
jgi:hypothetical protein